MPSLEFLRRKNIKSQRKLDEAKRALEDIKNRDGNPEAVAEIALENIEHIERKRD